MKYHYTECGLDNVYLLNGVEITKMKNGDEEIFIHDIHGLHKAIGMAIISKRGLLTGKEVKFIRTTFDWSQASLAKILGCTYQTVLLYEKGRQEVSKAANNFLKAIFLSYLNPENGSTIYDRINEIADLDSEAVKNNRIELKEIEHQWRMVA